MPYNVEIKINLLDAHIDPTYLLKNVCNGCAKGIKKNARSLFYNDRKKYKYADGWRYKIVKTKKDEVYGIVYNATQPSLAHLLEYGHLTRFRHGKYGTKRTWVPPQKHIRPAYEKARNSYYEKAKNIKIEVK